MDLVIGLSWLLAFSVIVLFLGALNYFIGRSHSDIPILESHQANKSQNQRRKARRQRKAAAAAAVTPAKTDETSNNDENDQETKSILSEKNFEQEEDDEDSAIQLTNENDEDFEDPLVFEHPTSTIQEENEQDKQEPLVPIKPKTKSKSNRSNSKISHCSNNENFSSTKPQASVAPVKQNLPIISSKSIETNKTSHETYSISNNNFKHYSYSNYNPLPPRFQQYQQKDFNNRQKSGTKKTQQTSFTPNSIQQSNDFVSLTLKQQINNNNNNHHHHHQQSTTPDDYSSESDILTESSSTAAPLSTESQHSLSSDKPSINEFLSIFEKNAFSSDELNLILNKLTTKYLTKKQDRQHSTKTNKTLERILDETYRSQAKILAIELQTEKKRVIELSKISTDFEATLQQIQQPNPNLAQYQQTVVQYQMQIRRLTDENAHLVQQLHACSMMPISINEFRQQELVFNEQIKQLSTRNLTLEQEINDGERASKQAAEIYKRSDTQKQERIEQMMNDLNKYKKIDRDLNNLRVKHNELEKNLTDKLNCLIDERDQMKIKCQQFKMNCDQFIEQDNRTTNLIQLEQEFNELKEKNQLLKQRNAKIVNELNKYSVEQNQNE